MARKVKDTRAQLYRTTLTLERGSKVVFNAIAPGNDSLAARMLIRFALEHGAMDILTKPDAKVDVTTKDPFADW